MKAKNLAAKLQTILNPLCGPLEAVGLKFVFFDGEEAFVEWTDDDSL